MLFSTFFHRAKVQETGVFLGFISVGFFLGGVLFYLTPLKHVNILNPGVKKIAPADFYDEYVKNPDRYVAIDIRVKELRARDYPEMAISTPLYGFMGIVDALPRNKSIIVFCESNFSATVAYNVLQNQGFRDVRIIDGGTPAWREAGLPLITGKVERVKIANEILQLQKKLRNIPE